MQKFADCGADFIVGCEFGGRRQGVKKVNINMNHIVHSVLPDAKCKTSGAYFAVHKCLPVKDTRLTRLQSDIWKMPCSRAVDLFWQIFTVTEATRGAAQSAGSSGEQPLVGFVVGIWPITMLAKGRPPSTYTRRIYLSIYLFIYLLNKARAGGRLTAEHEAEILAMDGDAAQLAIIAALMEDVRASVHMPAWWQRSSTRRTRRRL